MTWTKQQKRFHETYDVIWLKWSQTMQVTNRYKHKKEGTYWKCLANIFGDSQNLPSLSAFSKIIETVNVRTDMYMWAYTTQEEKRPM